MESQTWRTQCKSQTISNFFQVSRTFGDVESKLPELGGIPGCVSPEPEITTFDWDRHTDYVLLACDGVFDVLSNDEVNDIIWETVNFYRRKHEGNGKFLTKELK